VNVYGEMAKIIDGSAARLPSRKEMSRLPAATGATSISARLRSIQTQNLKKEIRASGHLCHENYVSSSIQCLFLRIEPRTTETNRFLSRFIPKSEAVPEFMGVIRSISPWRTLFNPRAVLVVGFVQLDSGYHRGRVQ
jgi:hypothetical protein